MEVVRKKRKLVWGGDERMENGGIIRGTRNKKIKEWGREGEPKKGRSGGQVIGRG